MFDKYEMNFNLLLHNFTYKCVKYLIVMNFLIYSYSIRIIQLQFLGFSVNHFSKHETEIKTTEWLTYQRYYRVMEDLTFKEKN